MAVGIGSDHSAQNPPLIVSPLSLLTFRNTSVVYWRADKKPWGPRFWEFDQRYGVGSWGCHPTIYHRSYFSRSSINVQLLFCNFGLIFLSTTCRVPGLLEIFSSNIHCIAFQDIPVTLSFSNRTDNDYTIIYVNRNGGTEDLLSYTLECSEISVTGIYRNATVAITPR